MLSRLLPIISLIGLSTICQAQSTTSAPASAAAPAASASATTQAATNAQPAAAAKDLAVTINDNGKTLKLADNDAAAISLAGNPTTGFSWSVTKVEGDSLAPDGDIQYIADKVPAGMVGSGGTYVAHFRPVKSGTTTITLTYARPWEKNTPPAKTFTVTIVVD